MPRFQEFRQQYGHVVRFLWVLLACLSVTRVLLVTLNFSRLDLDLLPRLLLQGLRFDLILAAYLCAMPVLLSMACPWRMWAPLGRVLQIWYRASLVLVIGMETLGFGFLREYDHRPDGLLWEYLSYPHEVLSMLWGGFKLEAIVTLMGLALAWKLGKLWLKQDSWSQPARPAARLLLGLLCCVTLTLMMRSSLGHRPANISSAIFSTNRLANELALNSLYTAGYALYARKNDSGLDLVPDMPLAQALDTVSSATWPASQTMLGNPAIPSLHQVAPTQPLARPRNVVIILEESLGARFVGALGGAKLTPRLDSLSKKGMWLTNLYATGTRTVRGIEAVLCGYPPSTARSVVKRNLSRRNFFTLADALKPHGYESIFVYGGEPNFDDMGSFMLGNGFDRLVAGEGSFPQAQYSGSWGVSDEDWARQAHAEFEKAQQNGPFFGFMLSTSNHTPWEFPAGRIKPGSGPLASRANAVRYADYALGLFFDLALNSSYAKDTVFVVVADHDARVAGNDLVPVDRFRIPGLIIAPGLAAQEYSAVASQLDLVPTILPLLGVPLQTPMLGRDLLAPDLPQPGRAIMQYGSNVALLRGDHMVVNTPAKQPLYFRLHGGDLRPSDSDPELQQLATAYLNLAEKLYSQRAYRMPEKP